MQALLTPDHEMIAETAARMATGGLARARAVLNGQPVTGGPTQELYQGWSSLGVPEAQGGAGGMVAAVLLAHALGEAAEPTPFLAHFQAVHALAGAGLAARLLNSEARATIANAEGVATSSDATLVVSRVGPVWRLSQIEGWEEARSLDPARQAGKLVPGELLAQGDDDGNGLERVQVLLAAEACGVGRGAIRLAADHARTREQFGKPIGSYQAIGHRLAQAAANLEAAWSLTLHAAWSLDDAPHVAIMAARMAKAAAGDAAIYAGEACVQTHGGMGITCEADPHLYLKRALALDGAWGRAAALNREIGSALLA